MSENQAAMSRFVDALRSGGYGTEFYAADVIVHDWTMRGRVVRGRTAAMQEIIEPSALAFPDGRILVLDTVMSGQDLVVRADWVATFVEDYGGIAATGKEVRWEILDQYRFKDGQIMEIWFAGDTLQAARALGALPDKGAPW